MKELIELLGGSAKLYKDFLELEYKKYDAIIKNDIETLNDIVAKEQVYYLKMRGFEQKREKILSSTGYKNKTLKDIIDIYDDDDKEKKQLKVKYDELDEIITEAKKAVNHCKTLIEVRMRRISKAMSQLGENKDTYSENHSNNKAKSIMISKKI